LKKNEQIDLELPFLLTRKNEFPEQNLQEKRSFSGNCLGLSTKLVTFTNKYAGFWWKDRHEFWISSAWIGRKKARKSGKFFYFDRKKEVISSFGSLFCVFSSEIRTHQNRGYHTYSQLFKGEKRHFNPFKTLLFSNTSYTGPKYARFEGVSLTFW